MTELLDPFKKGMEPESERSPLKDITEGPTTEDKIKSSFRDFINNFKIHKSPGKKEPFKLNSGILFGALAFICIALIVLSFLFENIAAPLKSVASIVVVPAQNGINVVGTWLTERLDEVNTITNLVEENRSLRSQISELKTENNELKRSNSELERLRSLLDLQDEYSDYDTIAAKIISKDSSKWFSSFTINKGSKDGIKQNMNVVAQGGLAGVICDVSYNYATVRTVINDESNISAAFENGIDLCIVKGNLSSMDDNIIDFSDASINAEVTSGMEVITSSVSSIYLPGLLIGTVQDYQVDGNGLTKSGHITPVVDFENLSEVLIITQLKETEEE